MIKIPIYKYMFNFWKKIEKRFSGLVYYEGKKDIGDNIFEAIE